MGSREGVHPHCLHTEWAEEEEEEGFVLLCQGWERRKSRLDGRGGRRGGGGHTQCDFADHVMIPV